MENPADFIRNLALVLCAAAVTTVVFQKLRQPVVLGYLLAGVVIGPHVPVPLVADRAVVETLAETGVILLMFAIGLEFSLRKLFRVGRVAGVVAVVQVAIMVWLGYVTAHLLGWGRLEAIFTGAVIAISSTTIIAKAFDEQQVAPRLRELVFAILVVEDLLGILLIAALTPMARGAGVSASELFATTVRLAGFLVAVVVGGLLIVPRVIRFVLRLDRAETTIVATVGFCFALALLAHHLGYSVALGAFLAGSLVAEAGDVHPIERLILPLRDVFAAIFFVAVGMLIDPITIAHHWGAIALLTAVVVVGKLVGVGLGAFLVGTGVRTATQAGMSLAQIGEFSFIIAGVGLSSGATGQLLYQIAVAVSAITTLLTPWLIRASGPVSDWVDRHLPHRLHTFVALYGTWVAKIRAGGEGRAERSRVRRALRWILVDAAILAAMVIAVALGVRGAAAWVAGVTGLGATVSRTIVVTAAAVVSAPFALGIIRSARVLAETWAAQVLPQAKEGVDLGAAPRRMLVITVEMASVLVVGVALTALTQPFLPLAHGALLLAAVLIALGIAFWRSARSFEGHIRAGAQVVMEILARQSHATASATASASASALSADAVSDEAERILPGIGRPIVRHVPSEGRAAGKSLRELNLRGRTGATVIAIQHEHGGVASPGAGEVLEAGDLVVLVGTDEAIEAASELLDERGSIPPTGGE